MRPGHQYITPTGQRRARQIQQYADQGMTAVEISRLIGINRQRVCKIAERYCIPLHRPHSRRISAYHATHRAKIVEQLAKEADVSPAVMVDRAVRLLVDEGIEVARKRLGKMAIAPKTREPRSPKVQP